MIVSMVKIFLDKMAKKCDVCNNSESTLMCYECGLEYCQQCRQLHDRFPAHNQHTIVDNQDRKCGIMTEKFMCNDHNEKNSRFCATCKCFLCPECIIGKHKLHNIQTIQDVASEYRNQSLFIGTGVVETLKAVSELK